MFHRAIPGDSALVGVATFGSRPRQERPAAGLDPKPLGRREAVAPDPGTGASRIGTNPYAIGPPCTHQPRRLLLPSSPARIETVQFVRRPRISPIVEGGPTMKRLAVAAL